MDDLKNEELIELVQNDATSSILELVLADRLQQALAEVAALAEHVRSLIG